VRPHAARSHAAPLHARPSQGWLPAVGEPEKQSKTAGPRPPSERGCTDVLCLLAFLGFWMGMLVIMAVSVATGNINAITYGADYKGNRCGQGAYANLTKTFYPRIDLDMTEQAEFIAQGKPWLVRLYGLCTDDCISERRVAIGEEGQIAPVERANYHWIDKVSTPRDDLQESWVSVLPEISILNRCLPYAQEEASSKIYCYLPTCTDVGVKCELKGSGDPDSWLLANHADKAEQCQVTRTLGSSNSFANYRQSVLQTYVTGQLGSFFGFMESLRESRVEIGVCSLCFSALAAFAWLVYMRYTAKVVIYVMIGLMFSTLLTLTAITFALSCFIENPQVYDCAAARLDTFSYSGVSLENLTVFRAAFFICLLFFIIFTASMVYLRRAIETCIAIVREASVVVGEMPTVFALPACACVLAVGVFLYFIYIGAYIATSYETTWAYFDANDPTSLTDAFASDGQNTLYFMALYHLFGTLWALSFILGFVTLSLSGGVASWFFYRETAELYPRYPMLSSATTTVRFHLGTIAFGSLLVALCQLIRVVLEYMDRQTKGLQESNVFARFVLKCVKCFMWCLEKCARADAARLASAASAPQQASDVCAGVARVRAPLMRSGSRDGAWRRTGSSSL